MKNTIISILLVTSLIGAVGVIVVTEKATELKAETRIVHGKIDVLAKSKESLQGDFDLLKTQSNELTQQLEKSRESDKYLKTQLAASRMEIAKKDKDLTDLNRKSDENLTQQQKMSASQIADLKKASDHLQAENKNLQAKVTTLQNSNKQLADDLANARLISKDNILIESLAANGKPHSKGKKVRKIVTEFSIKKDLQNPTFRIFGPGGEELPDANGNFSLERIAEGGTASLKPKKIKLTYAPTKKMVKGLYQIEVLNDNKHMGNLMIMFR